MEVHDGLLQAADLLEREGWIRGSLARMPGTNEVCDPRTPDVPRCIDGALRAVFQLDDATEWPHSYLKARYYVRRALGISRIKEYSIEQWNDGHARDVEHVVAVLHRAAELSLSRAPGDGFADLYDVIVRTAKWWTKARNEPEPVAVAPVVTARTAHDYELSD